ncbi:hypothetical protein QTP88_011418 [Uroleucon formosanum]
MANAENVNGSPVISLRLSPNIISEAFKVLNSSSATYNISELNDDVQNYESNNNNNDCTESTSGVYFQNNNTIQNNSGNTSLVDDCSSHELLKQIHGTVVSINMYVQRLDARIDKLEKANLFVEKNSSQKTAASFDDLFLNLFSLKSIEDLTKIEQMIINDDKE